MKPQETIRYSCSLPCQLFNLSTFQLLLTSDSRLPTPDSLLINLSTFQLLSSLRSFAISCLRGKKLCASLCRPASVVLISLVRRSSSVGGSISTFQLFNFSTPRLLPTPDSQLPTLPPSASNWLHLSMMHPHLTVPAL